MLVSHMITYGSKTVRQFARVVHETETDYIVDWKYDRVEYRGKWPKNECQIWVPEVKESI